jgi:hypothetical protein
MPLSNSASKPLQAKHISSPVGFAILRRPTEGSAMLHLSPETEALVRAKAEAAGTTPDELLRRILRSEPRDMRRPDIARMTAIARRTASLPVLDDRPAKEIADEGWGL